MVIRDSQQDLHDGLGFSTGSVWWFGVVNEICLVVRDYPKNLYGGYGFPTESLW